MKRRQKHVDVKRGPLSADEKAKIEVLQETKTDEEISSLLKRPLKQVRDYKHEYLANAPAAIVKRNEAEEYRRELHSQADWILFQTQFTPQELTFFEGDYINYRGQLKDMTPAERKQLYHLITLDIFMQRHNADRMKAQKDIDRLETLLKRQYDQPQESQNQELIINLESQIQACRSSSNSKTKEYKDLLDKYQSILRDLKTTRDQRIKNLEDRGKFVIFLKQLEEEDRRRVIGEVSGLMDLAVEKEKDRLSSYHKYMDGMVDIPLLTPDTVGVNDG